MALSIRLEATMERDIHRAAKRLKLPKSDLIRKCLKKFLAEVNGKESSSPYQIYKAFEGQIPGSGHGSLSTNHRSEVLKKIRQRRVS